MERGFAAIQVLYKFRNPAGEAEFRVLLSALVRQRDFQALVQEG